MTSAIEIIRSPDVSVAWGRAFLSLLKPGVNDLVPLIVNISGFPEGHPLETSAIRNSLDAELGRVRTDNKTLYSCATTSNLIFPENLWAVYRQRGRDAFFQRYQQDTYPRLKKADSRNRKGTYFLRLLAYGPSQLNQLEHVIQTWQRGNHRRSALQLMVFDPLEDHSNQPFMDFPCLDHIAFAFDATGGLSLTAFYANQFIFDRAYGNYLGLCALGRFMAEQFGLVFRQLTCVAGVAQLGSINKTEARTLQEAVIAAIPNSGDDTLSIANQRDGTDG